MFKGVCSIIQDCIVAFLLHCLKTEYLMKIIYFMLFGFLFFTVTKAGSGNITCGKMLTVDNPGGHINFNYNEKANNPGTYLFNVICHFTGYTAVARNHCYQMSQTNNNRFTNKYAVKRVMYISSRIPGARILEQSNGQVAVLVNPEKNSAAQFRVVDLPVNNEITWQNSDLNSCVYSNVLNDLIGESIAGRNGILF